MGTNAAPDDSEIEELVEELVESEDMVAEDAAGHACNQRLGQYRLCFEIAHGGMATVYLARKDGPAGFGKLVALKRIHPHLARQRAFVEMFLDEARIASLLSHPNVCGVTDFGEADGTYYLTMEYLVGESLSQVHRRLMQRQRAGRTPSSLSVACRIVADACEGLHSAHELRGPQGETLNLVHRDISPHNLFVTFDGAVKVVDFGIASAAGRLHHTKTGAVKGKFAYMAPEMFRGHAVDRRADVWAMGVVLWELIALKRLFGNQSDSETLLAVMQKPIPRLADVRADVPAELERIVGKALSRDPAGRYASARDMGQDLSRFIAQRREAVTMLEVAKLMHELFPDGPAKKQQLIQIAMQIEEGVIPSITARTSDGSLTTTLHSMTAAVSRVLRTRKPVIPLVAIFVTALLMAALVGGLVVSWWRRPAVRSVAAPDAPAAETAKPSPAARPEPSVQPAMTSDVSSPKAPQEPAAGSAPEVADGLAEPAVPEPDLEAQDLEPPSEGIEAPPPQRERVRRRKQPRPDKLYRRD